MGFEPTTSAVTGRRSNQLSHRAKQRFAPSKLHTCYILIESFYNLAIVGQALTLLVTVSSVHYCTSTPALSTSSSSRGFTSFEWDISS